MKKDPRVYLAQILERINRIREYTVEGKKAFFADPRTQDAVIRNFEVIGEAAKRIPDEYRKKNPTIPWRELSVRCGVWALRKTWQGPWFSSPRKSPRSSPATFWSSTAA